MKNLLLEQIDLSEPPEFNTNIFKYWTIKNDLNLEQVVLEAEFSNDEVNDIIKLGRSFFFDKSKTQNGVGFSAVRKSYNSWIPPCKLTEKLYIRITDLINTVNKKYFEFDIISLEHLQYTEYDEDYQGKYERHVDRYINPEHPGSHRKLSFSIQLSESESYDGGDLLLYTSNHPIRVTRKIGTITFFPSYILHEVTPVTRGCRNSLVGWVSGPRFK